MNKTFTGQVIPFGGQPPATDPDAGQACELVVGGMDCPSCAETITRSLRTLEGVRDVRVDVVGGKVRVQYAEGKLARGDIAGAIGRVGFRVEQGEAQRASFIVEGMDCADEVQQIEDKLSKLPGVTDLHFDLVARRLIVAGSITSAEVGRTLKDIGMIARPEGEETKPLSFWERRGRLVLTALSGSLLALALMLHRGFPRPRK